MTIKKFIADDWIVYWAGGYSLLSDSYFGKQYMCKPYMSEVEMFIPQVAFLYKGGLTTACIRRSDKIKFCNEIKDLVTSGKLSIENICKSLKKETDNYLAVIDRDEGKNVSFEEFMEYVNALFAYYSPHVVVKNILDVFTNEEMEKYAKLVEEARVYAEPVFTRSEEYMDTLVNIISQKTGYQTDLILATLSDEFEEYLKSGNLPSKDILQTRHQKCVLTFDNNERKLWLGPEAKNLKKIILGDEDSDEVKGDVGYKGLVRGNVRVILDPKAVGEFKDGDILVAEMTRPDYLHLLKKAAAIVTDAGGILCHAAIIAREMKKPCVIGTKIASKVFKNGDLVEVDANKGIVKKI